MAIAVRGGHADRWQSGGESGLGHGGPDCIERCFSARDGPGHRRGIGRDRSTRPKPSCRAAAAMRACGASARRATKSAPGASRARLATASELLKSHRCCAASAAPHRARPWPARRAAAAGARRRRRSRPARPPRAKRSASQSRPPSPRTTSTRRPGQSRARSRCHSASESKTARRRLDQHLRPARRPRAAPCDVPGPVEPASTCAGQSRCRALRA